MRFIVAFLAFFIPISAFSSTIWTYDLRGKVDGPDTAANYLRDISVGDDFRIRMNIWLLDSGSHGVSFFGNIGGWLFEEQVTSAFYYAGDNSRERFLTGGSSSHLNPPIGSMGGIDARNLYIQIFGSDLSGDESFSEDDRLVKKNGWIDPGKVDSGRISFNFWAMINPEIGESIETDLYGSIHSFVEVPEPDALALFCIGLLGIFVFDHKKKKAFRF